MMRALLIISALVVLAVAGVGATSASAAGLTLTTAPQHYVGTESACALGMANGSPVIGSTSAAVGVAGSYSQVALSGIPNACAGLPLDVNVHGASGEVLATGVTTAGVGSATAAVGAYSAGKVGAVVARMGGWLFPTSWTAPNTSAMSCVSASKEGVPNNEPCEIKLKGDGPTWWGESGPNRMGYIFFTVTTEAENAIVTLDTSSGDFPDWDIVGVSTNKDWIAAPGYSCEQFPEVQLYASPGHGGKGTPVYLEFWENPADSKPSDVTICPKPPLPNE